MLPEGVVVGRCSAPLTKRRDPAGRRPPAFHVERVPPPSTGGRRGPCSLGHSAGCSEDDLVHDPCQPVGVLPARAPGLNRVPCCARARGTPRRRLSTPGRSRPSGAPRVGSNMGSLATRPARLPDPAGAPGGPAASSLGPLQPIHLRHERTPASSGDASRNPMRDGHRERGLQDTLTLQGPEGSRGAGTRVRGRRQRARRVQSADSRTTRAATRPPTQPISGALQRASQAGLRARDIEALRAPAIGLRRAPGPILAPARDLRGEVPPHGSLIPESSQSAGTEAGSSALPPWLRREVASAQAIPTTHPGRRPPGERLPHRSLVRGCLGCEGASRRCVRAPGAPSSGTCRGRPGPRLEAHATCARTPPIPTGLRQYREPRGSHELGADGRPRSFAWDHGRRTRARAPASLPGPRRLAASPSGPLTVGRRPGARTPRPCGPPPPPGEPRLDRPRAPSSPRRATWSCVGASSGVEASSPEPRCKPSRVEANVSTHSASGVGCPASSIVRRSTRR